MRLYSCDTNQKSRPIYCARPEPIAFCRIDNIGSDQGSSVGSEITLSPTDVSLRQRNLMQGVAEFAIVLQ